MKNIKTDKSKIYEKNWNEVKLAISEIDFHVQKNINGFSSPGIFVRKSLRNIRKALLDIINLSLEISKEKRESKKPEK